MNSALLTAFEPFGGDSENASEAAVFLLPDRIGSFRIHKLLLPVAFIRAADIAISEAERMGVDIVLSVGQAAGRANVTPETVALNLQYASIPDNDGACPRGTPIDPQGREAFFSTLPPRLMAEAISASGIPSAVSYHAGTYVCNDVFYRLSSRFCGTSVRVGFIHVPPTSTLSARLAADAIIRAIESVQ